MKAIGDGAFDPSRAAVLTSWGGGATYMHEAASLATTALGGCVEANKIAISLTDGQLDDHESTRAVLEEARKRGVVTFGLLVGSSGLNPQRMDELYGPGNWAAINDLKEMPQQVGKRLATIFKRLRPL
jgi:nitric oxide reductase activation protein